MSSLVIAVTGGIGSGKSTLCALIKKLGYPVYSADETYAELIKNEEFVKGIHSAVGAKTDSKTLDREEVSRIVFSCPEKLEALNGYTHKKIVDKMFEKSRGKAVVFHEVPLLFEGGFENLYDNIIIVARPLEDRINSVVKRSSLSVEEVEKRIKNQFSYENLDNIKHTVITNDGDESQLEERLKAVIDEIIG
ncbi:MAG: dephospho-CoA kinase [Clostridia bacterium]|nr:dephospho-CoA kinase [Clostridia bacterium]